MIALPPKLTDALQLPTSSRSADGFTQFGTLFPDGLGEVEKVSTKGGYTFFVPVDDAFASATGVKEAHVCPLPPYPSELIPSTRQLELSGLRNGPTLVLLI